MIRLIVTILANGVGLYGAIRFIEGVTFTGTYLELAIAALVLSLLNWLIRPLVKFITSPLIFLTFGLFWIVINMGMLFLLDLLIPSLIIQTLAALLWATLLVGFVNLLISPAKK